MPGPADVLWSSSPGDCQYYFYVPGPNPNQTFTLSVPPLVETPARTCLLCVVNGGGGYSNFAGPTTFITYTPTGGVSRSPDIYIVSNDLDNNIPEQWFNTLTGHGSVFSGAMWVVSWNGIDLSAGGTIAFDVSTIAFNGAAKGASGVALACAVRSPTLQDGSTVNLPSGTSATVQDPGPTGLVLGIAMSIGDGLLSVTGDGWSLVTTDHQVAFPSVFDGPWVGASAGISVYDYSTQPKNLTESWSLSVAGELTLVAAIRIGGFARGRNSAQVIG